MKLLSTFVVAVLLFFCLCSVFVVALAAKDNSNNNNKKILNNLVKNYPSWLLRTNDDNGNATSGSPNVNFEKQVDFHNTTAYILTLKNARSNHWHVYCHGCASEHKCNEEAREVVSVQAQQHDCLYATNAAPFSYHLGAACNGYVISDGVVMANSGDKPAGNTCLGITKNFGHWWIGDVGAVTKDDLQTLDQLVCGFGFLVIDGKPQYSPVTEIAPRTAWGINELGDLISMVADGSEVIKTGLTLNSTADWMVKLGAKYAVNMDGGGSSTTWFEGKVRGCPTGIDVPMCIERQVVSTQCIK